MLGDCTEPVFARMFAPDGAAVITVLCADTGVVALITVVVPEMPPGTDIKPPNEVAPPFVGGVDEFGPPVPPAPMTIGWVDPTLDAK